MVWWLTRSSAGPSRPSLSLLLGASSALFASCAQAQLVSTGLSVTLSDVPYYISPFSSGNVSTGLPGLSSVPAIFGFKPVTVVGVPVARSELEPLFANWTATDDVFQPAFLGAVFLAGSNASCITRKDLSGGGGGGSSTSVIIPLASTGGAAIPSGPYFLETATGRLFPVYRLYADWAGAFSESLLQRPDGGFQSLSAHTLSSSASLTVGVPSRLYYTRTADKPLAGVRIGVKDIYSLRGVKNSLGSRAWYQLYPPAPETAPSMQRLVDAGAVIVGLQKPSQFANGESPTADWVDYHAPFNPRGDGYQDPSSSSSGAGASAAAYDWLDIAVGSDTGGSIRGPSGAQGLFGNRPSHGLVSLDKVMPLSTALDTAGFLLRDPYLWDVANLVMFDGSKYNSLAGRQPSYPKTIYTLGFPSATSTSPSAAILNGFAARLSEFVGGGGGVTPMSIADEWARTRPTGAGNTSLSDLLTTTYAVFITKEQTALVRDPFYRDYAAAFDGRRPFVNPAPLARWAYGDSLPTTALDEAVRNKTLFMDWFNGQVLAPVADPLQCSSALMLYVSSSGGGQSYRNRYSAAPGVPLGFSSGRISVMSECPDSVFPLGEVTARSTISNHDESYPVAVSVMAAKGCDGLIAKLAADLTDAGVLTPPKTGRTLMGGIPAMG